MPILAATRLSTVFALILLLTACTDPLISIPGGRLSGEAASVPAKWTSVPDVVQVEFRPDDPYSINIWAVVTDGALYIATQDARWVPMIEANPEVRFRVDEKVYEMKAVRVTDETRAQTIGKTYEQKYDYTMDADQSLASADVFQLVPRS